MENKWLEAVEKSESHKESGFSLGALLGERLVLTQPKQQKVRGRGELIRYRNGKKITKGDH